MPDESATDQPVYVSAFFCQDVIRESDSFLTAFRITGAYTFSPLLISDPDGLFPAYLSFPPLKLHAVILLNTEKPASFFVQLKAFGPDGALFGPESPPIKCETKGGAEGHALNLTINLRSNIPGDCWMEVLINGLLVTKVPLRIVHGQPIIVIQQKPDVLQEHQSDVPPPSAASE